MYFSSTYFITVIMHLYIQTSEYFKIVHEPNLRVLKFPKFYIENYKFCSRAPRKIEQPLTIGKYKSVAAELEFQGP